MYVLTHRTEVALRRQIVARFCCSLAGQQCRGSRVWRIDSRQLRGIIPNISKIGACWGAYSNAFLSTCDRSAECVPRLAAFLSLAILPLLRCLRDRGPDSCQRFACDHDQTAQARALRLPLVNVTLSREARTNRDE